MRDIWSMAVLGAACVVSLLFLAGCVSDDPGSSSLAYVSVDTSRTELIRNQAIRVFADDDYQLAQESTGELVFEREATQRDQVLYGRYGEKLIMRVVVTIELRRQGGTLLRADAYAVYDRDETKVMRIARRPYQDLLNRIRANMTTAGEAE